MLFPPTVRDLMIYGSHFILVLDGRSRSRAPNVVGAMIRILVTSLERNAYRMKENYLFLIGIVKGKDRNALYSPH